MEKSRSKKIRFVGKKLHFPRMEEESLSITNAGAATPNQEDLVSRPGRIGPLITKKTPLRKIIDRNYDFDFEDEVGDDALTSLFDENHDRSGVGVKKVTSTDDEINDDDDDRFESSDYFDVEKNQEEFKNHHSDNSASDDDLSLAEIRLKSAEKRKRLISAVCKSGEGKTQKIIRTENFDNNSKQHARRSRQRNKRMTEGEVKKALGKYKTKEIRTGDNVVVGDFIIENYIDDVTSDETVTKHKKKRPNFSSRENKDQIGKHKSLHLNEPKPVETNKQDETIQFQEPIIERNKNSGKKKKNLPTRSRSSSSSNDEESSRSRSKPVKTYRKSFEIKNKRIIDKANKNDSIEGDSVSDSDIMYSTSDRCRKNLNHDQEVQIKEVQRLRRLVEDTINRKEQNKLDDGQQSKNTLGKHIERFINSRKSSGMNLPEGTCAPSVSKSKLKGKTKNSQNTVTFSSDVELSCYSDVEVESDEDRISSNKFARSLNDNEGNGGEDTLRGIDTGKKREKWSYFKNTPIVNPNHNPRFPRETSDEEIQIRDKEERSINKNKAYLKTGSTFFHEDYIPQRWDKESTNPNEDVYPKLKITSKYPKNRLSSRFIGEQRINKSNSDMTGAFCTKPVKTNRSRSRDRRFVNKNTENYDCRYHSSYSDANGESDDSDRLNLVKSGPGEKENHTTSFNYTFRVVPAQTLIIH